MSGDVYDCEKCGESIHTSCDCGLLSSEIYLEKIIALKKELGLALKHLSTAYKWGLWYYEDENIYEDMDDDDREEMGASLDTVMKFLNKEREI